MPRKRTSGPSPSYRLLAALHEEIAESLQLLAGRHDERAQGQREALHHVQTFLRNQAAELKHPEELPCPPGA